MNNNQSQFKKHQPKVNRFLTDLSKPCNQAVVVLRNYFANDKYEMHYFPFLENVVKELENNPYPLIDETIKRKLEDCLLLVRYRHNQYQTYKNALNQIKGKIQYDDLLEVLVICLELSTYAYQFDRQDVISLGLPTYSKEALQALYEVLKEAEPHSNAPEVDRAKLSVDKIATLLACKYRMIWVRELRDMVIFDDYVIHDLSGGIFHEFTGNHETNRYSLEVVKEKLKTQVYAHLSKDLVSEDAHFQMHDARLKTNEGFAAMFVSNATVLSSPEGATSLSYEMTEEDQKRVEEGKIPEGLMLLMTEQWRTYHYRHFLQEHYIPKAEDNIREMHVYVETGICVTVYSVLALAAYIKAYAQFFHNPLPVREPNSVFIKNWFEFPENAPTGDETSEQLANNGSWFIWEFVKEYENIIDNDKIPFDGFILATPIDTFLGKIKEENEDLKMLTLDELKAILRFITSLEDIKLSGLLFKNGYLQIIPHAFATIDHIENIYNEILERLYNNQKRESLGILEPAKDKEREEKICKSLAEMFNKRFGNGANIAQANIDFGANGINSGDLRGEFDVIVVDEANKAILCIELKLKNTYLFNRRGRWAWFQEKIVGNGKIVGRQDEIGAKQQIEKYLKYFASDCGRNQIKETFGKDINMAEYKVYTLVVTDNFYFDHVPVDYKISDRGLSTMIVSFFELKALLENLSLLKENTYNWVLYNYVLIQHMKPNEAIIEYLNNNTNNATPSQDTIDFINTNKYEFVGKNFSIPNLLDTIRKKNAFWYPVHKYNFE